MKTTKTLLLLSIVSIFFVLTLLIYIYSIDGHDNNNPYEQKDLELLSSRENSQDFPLVIVESNYLEINQDRIDTNYYTINELNEPILIYKNEANPGMISLKNQTVIYQDRNNDILIQDIRSSDYTKVLFKEDITSSYSFNFHGTTGDFFLISYPKEELVRRVFLVINVFGDITNSFTCFDASPILWISEQKIICEDVSENSSIAGINIPGIKSVDLQTGNTKHIIKDPNYNIEGYTKYADSILISKYLPDGNKQYYLYNFLQEKQEQVDKTNVLAIEEDLKYQICEKLSIDSCVEKIFVLDAKPEWLSEKSYFFSVYIEQVENYDTGYYLGKFSIENDELIIYDKPFPDLIDYWTN